MTEDSQLPFDLPAVKRKKVTADFGGGLISSDGGLVLLRGAERRLGLAEALAGCIREWRDPALVVHTLPAMLRFRMFAIACGYEDADDCDAGDIEVSDAVLAPGYGRLNEAAREAMALAARHEGLLLDPVYTAKAMAGLIAHVRSGRIAAGSRVLFVHTGGQPALFAYADSLGSWLSEAPDGQAR